MDKVAMYKEYIMEKVAINAQKARAMADEAGLLPIGNWKYGLRNMRNMHTGDLLQGKELAEAKTKLGASSNNAYQKIKAESRKLPSNTEMAGILSKKDGSLQGTKKGNIRSGAVENPYIDKQYMNMHTHPYHPGETKYESLQNALNTFYDKNGKGKTITRLQGRSADETMERMVKADNANRKVTNARNPLSVDPSGGMTRHLGKVTGDNNMKNTISKLNHNATPDNKIKSINLDNRHYEEPVADMRSFLDTKDRGEKQTIINPNQDYEAIHRVSPYKKTSLFFDRSPRNTR